MAGSFFVDKPDQGNIGIRKFKLIRRADHGRIEVLSVGNLGWFGFVQNGVSLQKIGVSDGVTAMVDMCLLRYQSVKRKCFMHKLGSSLTDARTPAK